MKKIFVISCIIGFIVTMLFASFAYDTKTDIADSLVRLHVLANSDSKEDQALKLQVRDAVLSKSKEILKDADSRTAVLAVIEENLDLITRAAEEEIVKNGYDYPVTATLEVTDFPTKYYKNIALPKGEYLALRVEIGAAKGQNWWCVLYPPLCFPGETGELKECDLAALKENLTDAEYDIITKSDSPRFKFKFRLLEIFGG